MSISKQMEHMLAIAAHKYLHTHHPRSLTFTICRYGVQNAPSSSLLLLRHFPMTVHVDITNLCNILHELYLERQKCLRYPLPDWTCLSVRSVSSSPFVTMLNPLRFTLKRPKSYQSSLNTVSIPFDGDAFNFNRVWRV